MRGNNHSTGTRVQALRKQLRELDPARSDYRDRRMKIMKDIQLARANQPKSQNKTPNKNGRVRPKKKTVSSKRKPTSSTPSKSKSTSSEKKGKGLSGLLSSENLQESLKQVNNLRSLVKNGLGYLQQADSLLETLYATSNNLRDTGVLDKLIKQKGKNLTTEDFTNILVALMNSPVGGQLLGGGKSSDNKSKADAGQAQNNAATSQNTTQNQSAATNQNTNSNGPQGYTQNPPQQGYAQGQTGQPGYPQPGMQQMPQGPQYPQQPQQVQPPQQQPPQQFGGTANQPPMGPYPPNQGIPGPMQQPQPPQTPPQQ